MLRNGLPLLKNIFPVGKSRRFCTSKGWITPNCCQSLHWAHLQSCMACCCSATP